MSGSLRAVVDTNIIFMALYDKTSKAGRIINAANKNKIELFSTDSIKEEIFRVLKRELGYSEEEVQKSIESFPITWIEKEIYERALAKTRVKHKADKPLEALPLILNCEILSADYHFENRADINKLLEDLKE